MKVVVATCTCLFLVRLAVFQKSNSCYIRENISACRNFKSLNFSRSFKGMQKHSSRILISNHHFQTLNKIEKICLLKKIMGFYKNMTSMAYTKEVSKENIFVLQDRIAVYTNTCINCKKCQKIRIRKPLMKCEKYKTSMVLNRTQIIHCQEWLLSKAIKTVKKGEAHAKQVLEKTIYEFDILQELVNEAHLR
ncbi:uncharacterized protein LOC143773704 isoform X1 [Ranitomeya variabilis]|uniref:uncharacterized protein LOC143773704 isoform X1 n=1 Tax=Ranitomeya variabilis TaxID=490064 RepID=UPI004057271E